MGDINVELGRSRTTANTLLAGGSTPITQSLFGLANNTVNKVAPHRISEFYGYNNNPGSTITGQIDINDPVHYAYGIINYNGISLEQINFGSKSVGPVTLSPELQFIGGEGYSSVNGYCYVEFLGNGTFLYSVGDFGFAYGDYYTGTGVSYSVAVSVSGI
jgi:hypothetical protein